MGSKIVCVGEVLWDAMPAALFLGGAPFNVACHLHELGHEVAFASRGGDDELGREIIRRLTARNISTELVQIDTELPTGYVVVELSEGGIPTYNIVEPSAWDAINLEAALTQAVSKAKTIVFGSLAQRSEITRDTIRKLLKCDALKVFDVNLRPPYDDRDVVAESLEHTDLVKLNDDELVRLGLWFDLPSEIKDAGHALCDMFKIDTLCVTKGERGALLLSNRSWYANSGYRVKVVDTVGSGDAFLAGDDPQNSLDSANALGAYVATCQGATEPHDADAIAAILKDGS